MNRQRSALEAAQARWAGISVERARCRELVAALMIRVGIATGHGDTIEELLGEVEATIVAAILRHRSPEAVALRIAREAMEDAEINTFEQATAARLRAALIKIDELVGTRAAQP